LFFKNLSGAKVSVEIDGDLIENREWISELVSITADSLPKKKSLKSLKMG